MRGDSSTIALAFLFSSLSIMRIASPFVFRRMAWQTMPDKGYAITGDEDGQLKSAVFSAVVGFFYAVFNQR